MKKNFHDDEKRIPYIVKKLSHNIWNIYILIIKKLSAAGRQILQPIISHRHTKVKSSSRAFTNAM